MSGDPKTPTALLGRYPAPAIRLALVKEAPGSRKGRLPVPTSEVAYQVIAPVLDRLVHERFIALALDSRTRLISVITVADGGATSCVVDPKILFGAALVAGATSVIVAHNHPSGDPTASNEDREMTRVLVAGGHFLGLPVVDHIIVGDGEFTSLRLQEPGLFSRVRFGHPG